MVFSKKVSEECIVLRRELSQVLVRIFGGELEDARIDDLPQVMNFAKHTDTCESCAVLGRQIAKTMWVRFDLRKIRE